MFSFDHENLKTNSKDYWDYSFSDIRYDIKANIHHIHSQTGGKKVHYIGHSTGSIAMFACLADKDEIWRKHADNIQEKIHIFYAIAPSVYTVY